VEIRRRTSRRVRCSLLNLNNAETDSFIHPSHSAA
jgi:hypothetical protein